MDYFAGNIINDIYIQPTIMFGTIDAVSYYIICQRKVERVCLQLSGASCQYDRVAYITILHTIGVAFTAISLIGSHRCQHRRTKKRDRADEKA